MGEQGAKSPRGGSMKDVILLAGATAPSVHSLVAPR